ncbi:MAG: Protein GrpE [candidate division TM6 bacterium GW2011_GWF2_37_49]|nr:MAG: Protein GrpE [candidate division TM6 bacterium GW2011_GWF2_37_49]
MFDTEKDASINSDISSEVENGLQEAPQEAKNVVDYRDLFLRLNADFQNFQKRIEKQKAEWLLIGEEAIILKLLPVLQDLDRALNAATAGTNEQPEAWSEGLSVVYKNLLKTMTDLDVKEVQVSGDFNPELHEAIAQVESSNHPSGQIVDVVSKGYLFKGKVVRYAQVTVAK